MDNRRAGQAASLWDRRDVLKAASAAAAGSMLVVDAAEAAPAFRNPSLYKIVADRRFAETRAFAAEASRAGQQIAWIRGDITDLWYDELDHLWRGNKSALAGLTERGAFFCLERLALDRGLRVVFKGEHRRLATGAISHVVTGPEAMATRGALKRMSGRDWAAQVAQMIVTAPHSGAVDVRLKATSPGDTEQLPLLVSWILAAKPDRRVRGDIA